MSDENKSNKRKNIDLIKFFKKAIKQNKKLYALDLSVDLVIGRYSKQYIIDTFPFFEENLIKHEYGCWEWTGSYSGGDKKPYGQLRIKRKDLKGKSTYNGVKYKNHMYTTEEGKRFTSNVPAHHYSLLYYKGVMINKGLNQQVSHLCHNKSCCNYEHLHIETSKINMSRQKCYHSFTCECGITTVICKHDPVCIFPDDERNPSFKNLDNQQENQ